MAASGKDLVFTLKDGSTVETSFLPPYSPDEQLAFEEHFQCSFLGFLKGAEDMASAARAADGDAPIDPSRFLRVGWMLFIGHRRARPAVVNKFSVFRTEQLADWNFAAPDEPADAEPDADPADGASAAPPLGLVPEDGSLDPTRVDPPSSPS